MIDAFFCYHDDQVVIAKKLFLSSCYPRKPSKGPDVCDCFLVLFQVQAGADLEARNSEGNTPLLNACLHSEAECVKV